MFSIILQKNVKSFLSILLASLDKPIITSVSITWNDILNTILLHLPLRIQSKIRRGLSPLFRITSKKKPTPSINKEIRLLYLYLLSTYSNNPKILSVKLSCRNIITLSHQPRSLYQRLFNQIKSILHSHRSSTNTPLSNILKLSLKWGPPPSDSIEIISFLSH